VLRKCIEELDLSADDVLRGHQPGPETTWVWLFQARSGNANVLTRNFKVREVLHAGLVVFAPDDSFDL